jgi:hypothetical protein
MSRKPISVTKLSDTLTLAKCHADSEHQNEPNFWLWDKTREMNLAMGATSPQDALLDALHYYQNRLATVEKDYRELSIKVDSFLAQFREDDDDEF